MNQTEKIDKAAILHIPLSQYAFATSEYSINDPPAGKKKRSDKMCALHSGPGMQGDPCLLFRNRYEG